MAAADVARATPEKRTRGRVHAWTRGTFHLSYELVREGDRIEAKRVVVTVRNAPEFLSAPTDRLREHEAVHGRINENEAGRIEKALSDFHAEGTTMARTEKILKERFRREVDAARRLHADWDENHIFAAPEVPAAP